MAELPESIITYIFYLARNFLSHRNEPHMGDIKLIKDITQYGVKRALLHISEIKRLRGAYSSYLEGYPMSMGHYIWGDTYHLTIPTNYNN